MSQLSKAQLKAAAKCIGKGDLKNPVISEQPLYKATEDGFNAATLHQVLTSNKRIVGICYTNNGAICGFHAPAGFAAGNGAWAQSDGTCIFQLVDSCKKDMHSCFSVVDGNANAIHCQPDGQVTLGNGNSLQLQIAQKRVQSASHAAYNGGVVLQPAATWQALTEFEVYSDSAFAEGEEKKKKKKPVIKPLSKKQLLERLLFARLPVGVEHISVLVYGPSGAGKSSFICTVDSLLKGRISEIVETGTGVAALTTHIKHILLQPDMSAMAAEMECTDDIPPCLALKILDVPGYDGTSYKKGELNYLLNGNLPDGYDMRIPISNGSPGFVSSPGINDAVNAIIFVVPATETKQKTHIDRCKELLDYARPLNIPVFVAVTKPDELLPELAGGEIGNLYQHCLLMEMCAMFAADTGVPPRRVLPIKTYDCEVAPYSEAEIPMLYLLDKVYTAAIDKFHARHMTGEFAADAAAAAAAPGAEAHGPGLPPYTGPGKKADA